MKIYTNNGTTRRNELVRKVKQSTLRMGCAEEAWKGGAQVDALRGVVCAETGWKEGAGERAMRGGDREGRDVDGGAINSTGGGMAGRVDGCVAVREDS